MYLYLYLLYIVFVSCPPGQFHLVTKTVLPKVEKQIALADHHHDHQERDSGWCWWPWCLCWWWNEKTPQDLSSSQVQSTKGERCNLYANQATLELRWWCWRNAKKHIAKNNMIKNIKTFKKNEGPSLPCGEQSIAWGIPTDKQKWSRVNNYKGIDLTKKDHQRQDETWSRERWLERLSPFPSPTWRICTWKQGYHSIPFVFFIGFASI